MTSDDSLLLFFYYFSQYLVVQPHLVAMCQPFLPELGVSLSLPKGAALGAAAVQRR